MNDYKDIRSAPMPKDTYVHDGILQDEKLMTSRKVKNNSDDA